MRVSELWRYPVKSMAGEPLDEAALTLEGIPGDRGVCVVDGRGQILSARTKPRLLLHHATWSAEGGVLVDGLTWDSPQVARSVREAAGDDARLVPASGPERFDVLPLLIATDGAIAALGRNGRRLRPNVVIRPSKASRSAAGRVASSAPAPRSSRSPISAGAAS